MGRKTWSIIALMCVMAMVGCDGETTSPAEPATGTLLVAERMFDGEVFVDDVAVLVEGRSIVAVGSIDDLGDRAANVMNLGDATLLPGFIDLHVHLGIVNGYTELPNEGVTTVRDLGIDEASLPFPDSGALQVIAAGPLLTTPGGYPIPVHGPRVAGPVEGTAEARAKVQDLADLGAEVIKVAIHFGRAGWPVLSLEELRAIVDEAHSHGLPVSAHVQERTGLDLALKAGVDDFAHLPCRGSFPRTVWEEVVAADIEIISTMYVLGDYCEGKAARTAQGFLDAGGTLLYGTDLGAPEVPFGIVIEELELMMEAGMSLEETLSAATSKSGDFLGLSPLGSVVSGAPADLIAVTGDLRDGLRSLAEPIFAMADGWVINEPGSR